jgi:hypothetical protein
MGKPADPNPGSISITGPIPPMGTRMAGQALHLSPPAMTVVRPILKDPPRAGLFSCADTG